MLQAFATASRLTRHAGHCRQTRQQQCRRWHQQACQTACQESHGTAKAEWQLLSSQSVEGGASQSQDRSACYSTHAALLLNLCIPALVSTCPGNSCITGLLSFCSMHGTLAKCVEAMRLCKKGLLNLQQSIQHDPFAMSLWPCCNGHKLSFTNNTAGNVFEAWALIAVCLQSSWGLSNSCNQCGLQETQNAYGVVATRTKPGSIWCAKFSIHSHELHAVPHASHLSLAVTMLCCSALSAWCAFSHFVAQDFIKTSARSHQTVGAEHLSPRNARLKAESVLAVG